VSVADRLNADCHAAGLSHAALQQAMLAQGESWHSLVQERCPHLFAEVPVFIGAAQLQQMRDVISAVERVVRLPGWNDEPGNAQHSSLGVFYGYDFHLNEQGVHLIEINSNAGGGFLNALLTDSQQVVELPGKPVAVENLGRTFLAMFQNEWRLSRSGAPLKSIAIVDEQPEGQYLYPEFLLAKKLFESAGVAVHIADPSALHTRDDGLYAGEQKVDLIYNRLTDFSLQQHPQLLSASKKQQVVLTPGPAHYARYADKRNLARLSDADGLHAFGASEADIVILLAGVPHTIVVQPRHGGAEHSGAGGAAKQLLPQSAGFAITNDLASVVGSPSRMASSSISNVSQLHPSMEEVLWAERKQWFFKPNSGYGSKGAYRGEKLTKRVFAEILQSGYVAQKMAAPGERSVCVNDGEAVSLKYDVRCYVYDGQIQLVAARLYQGQTTNFRTPGGGFALVRVVE